MLKIKCPTCGLIKRPYGFPRSERARPGAPHVNDYEVGTYEHHCSKCGTVLFIKMDYVVELAPVDIRECWDSGGKVAEIIDEKRGIKQGVKLMKKVNEEGEDEDDS